MAKYRNIGVLLTDLVFAVNHMVIEVDQELKKLANLFNEKVQILNSIEKKKIVNLSSSDFEDFLDPKLVESFQSEESEYLAKIMAIVPSSMEKGYL